MKLEPEVMNRSFTFISLLLIAVSLSTITHSQPSSKKNRKLLQVKNSGIQNDPLQPYLTREAPRVIKDLGVEIISDVKVNKLIFHSRNVKTLAGLASTEIFAIVARPVQAGNYPGLLVLHGGGGAAELDKAVGWAKQGYVVVTLDLPGIANPKNVPYSSGYWKIFEYGKQRFTASPDITHSTIFDAVVAAIQGLYLLYNQPDVIKERIGVTGISWGGYMTTMVSGLAGPLVKAAFSTYGCGFFDTNSTFLKTLNDMPFTEREMWLTYLDAGRRIKNITAPLFIAAATNDNWFYPPAVMATLNNSNAPVSHLFAPNANHSAQVPGGTSDTNRVGWLKMEETYFDYYLKDKGFSLPEISLSTKPVFLNTKNNNFKVQFKVKASREVVTAEVYYSISDTLWTKRHWVGIQATNLKNGWYEAILPIGLVDEKGYWFATVSDSRPVTVSGNMIWMNGQYPELLNAGENTGRKK